MITNLNVALSMACNLRENYDRDIWIIAFWSKQNVLTTENRNGFIFIWGLIGRHKLNLSIKIIKLMIKKYSTVGCNIRWLIHYLLHINEL